MDLINLISYIFLILSLLSIVFIIKRKIPALTALSEETLLEYESKRTSRRLSNYYLDKLEKYLHRSKITSLKIHNFFHRWTVAVKEKKNGTTESNTTEETK